MLKTSGLEHLTSPCWPRTDCLAQAGSRLRDLPAFLCFPSAVCASTPYFYFTCMDILPGCMFLHHIDAWCLQRPEEGVRSSLTVVSRHLRFTLRLGIISSLLEEQQTLLTTKPSLQDNSPHPLIKMTGYCFSTLSYNI